MGEWDDGTMGVDPAAAGTNGASPQRFAQPRAGMMNPVLRRNWPR